MATLLSWLGKTIHDTENNIGHFVQDTQKNVGNVVHGVQQAANTANQTVVQPIAQDVTRTYHTVQAPVTGLVGAGSAIGDKLFNGGKNYQNLLNATMMQMNKELSQSFVPQNIAHGQASVGDFGKSFASTGVHLAPYAIPGAGGALTKALGSRVTTGITKRVADSAGKQIAAKVAGNVTKNLANASISVPTFSALNAGQQLIDNGGRSFNIDEANQAGLTAGAMTAAGGLAGDVAGAGVKAAGKAISDLPKGVRKNAAIAAGTGQKTVSVPTKSLTDLEGAPDKYRIMEHRKNIQSGKDVGPLVVVKTNDGKMVVEDGKHRLAAYKSLGIKDVPAVVVSENKLHDYIRDINQGGYVSLGGDFASDGKNIERGSGSRGTNLAKANYSEGTSFSNPDRVAPNAEDSLPLQISQQRVQAGQRASSPSEPSVSPLVEPSVLPNPRILEDPRTPALGQLRKQIDNPYGDVTTSADGNIVKTPTGEVQAPAAGKATRYASKTIPESQFVGERVSAQTKKNAPTYVPETEQGRLVTTLKAADKQGFDNFEENIHQRLQSDHIDSQTVSDAQAVAQRLEAKGDTASLRRAADIYDKVSEHLTKAGQTVQAAAIMARRSPAGIRYQALNDLRKNGVTITDDMVKSINDHVNEIKKTAPGSDARKLAVGKLAKEVEMNIPAGAISNLVSVWKAGLLSGVKTTQGNFISNATFGGLRTASTPVTSVVDSAISLITGKRSMTATSKGTISGAIEGTKNGVTTMKTGVDLRTASDKYEEHRGISFKNQTLQKTIGVPAQKMFDFMSAQDQPFYYSQLRKSLHDMAKADGLNKGLGGKELYDHIEKTLNNPPDEMAQRAVDEANKAVLGYDTVAYKAIQGAKNGIENMPVAAPIKRIGKAVIDVLAPFTRVPTAFLSRSIDFTPLGIGKEVLTQIFSKKFDQRSLSRAIGEGLTGTGVIAIGVALANSGQLSGDYPTDPKEQQRWKAQGIQPNSVKLGGTWVSLNYLGPIGMLFGAGKKFSDSAKQGADALGATAAAIGGFGQTLLGQSFLQGLNGFIDAAKNPEQYAKSFVNSQAGSVVPAIVNDFANLTDGFQRQANNGWEAILNRLPGARETLNVKQDVYGNDLKQSPASTLIGVKPTPENHNPVIDEVGRLSQVDPQNSDLQITPTAVKQTLTVGDSQVKLTDQQRYDLQHKIGQATQDAWGKLIATDQYKSLSDADKAKKLTSLRQDVTAISQRQYVADNNLGTYTKSLTSSQSSLANGTKDVSSYATAAGTSTKLAPNLDKQSSTVLSKYDGMSAADRTKAFQSDNKAEFTYNQAKYNNDKASGKITPIQDIARKKALAKDQIGSDYSKDTRDLYGMSKAVISSYLSQAPNGNDLANQLKAYDQALYNAGLSSTLKFKTGIAPATRTSSRSSSGSRARSSSTRQPAVKGTAAYKSAITATHRIRVPKVANYKGSKATLTRATYKAPSLKTYSVKLPKVPIRTHQA